MEKIHSKLVGKTTRKIRSIQSGKEIKWWEAVERPDKKEVIKKIECRTQEQVIAHLKWNAIGGVRSHRWHDYEQAKKLIFEGLFIDSMIYDKQIGWICEFLKL